VGEGGGARDGILYYDVMQPKSWFLLSDEGGRILEYQYIVPAAVPFDKPFVYATNCTSVWSQFIKKAVSFCIEHQDGSVSCIYK